MLVMWLGLDMLVMWYSYWCLGVRDWGIKRFGRGVM